MWVLKSAARLWRPKLRRFCSVIDESIYDTETSIYDRTDAAECITTYAEILIIRQWVSLNSNATWRRGFVVFRRVLFSEARTVLGRTQDALFFFKINRIYIDYICALTYLIYDSVLRNNGFLAYGQGSIYATVSTYVDILTVFWEVRGPCLMG